MFKVSKAWILIQDVNSRQTGDKVKVETVSLIWNELSEIFQPGTEETGIMKYFVLFASTQS